MERAPVVLVRSMVPLSTDLSDDDIKLAGTLLSPTAPLDPSPQPDVTQPPSTPHLNSHEINPSTHNGDQSVATTASSSSTPVEEQESASSISDPNSSFSSASYSPFIPGSAPRRRPHRGSNSLTQSHHGPVDPSSLKVPRVYVGNLAFSVGWQDLKDFFRNSIGSVGRVEIISYPSGRSKGCAVVEFDSTGEAGRAINELNNAEIHGRKIFIREDREGKGFGSTGRGPGVGVGQQVEWVTPAVYGQGMPVGGVGLYPPYYQPLGLYYQQMMQQQALPPPNDQQLPPTPPQPVFLDALLHQEQPHNPLSPALFNSLYPPPPPFYPPTFEHPLPSPAPSHSPGSQLVLSNLPFSFTPQHLSDLASSYGEVVRADVLVDRVSGRSRGVGVVRYGDRETAEFAMEEIRSMEVEGRRVQVRQDDQV